MDAADRLAEGLEVWLRNRTATAQPELAEVIREALRDHHHVVDVDQGCRPGRPILTGTGKI
jgi:hypothetical protein